MMRVVNKWLILYNRCIMHVEVTSDRGRREERVGKVMSRLHAAGPTSSVLGHQLAFSIDMFAGRQDE